MVDLLFKIFVVLFFNFGCSTTMYNEDGKVIESPDKHEVIIKRLSLGKAYLSLEKEEDRNLAYVNFKKAYDLDNNFHLTNLYIAYFFEKNNSLASADLYYRKAFSIDPDHEEGAFRYALFLCNSGKVQDSLKFFGKAKSYINNNSSYKKEHDLCVSKYKNLSNIKDVQF